MAAQFPHLFSPVRIGQREAPNRVMRLATLTNSIQEGKVTEHTLAMYRRLARGGSGVIVTEGMRVHPSSTGHGHSLQLYQDGTVDSVRRLSAVVRAEGALIIAQLNHNGRQHHGTGFPTLWAPSAIPCPRSGGMPHAMTRSEIAELVEAFADGAARARDGGCDGVEVHGAQGHLIMQFVSPFSNRRDDEYGGSVENRLRFPLQIMRRIRAKAGRDFILGYRLGVEEFTSGGLAITDVVGFTPLLLAEGLVDFLSLTQGNFNSLDSHCPDSHYAPLAFIDLQAQVKAVAGKVPVVSTARVQTPAQAESILASGKADLVGMCRAIVADPEWALKAREGRSDDIRRCIFTCACWGSGKRLSCSVNPTVGQELDMPALEPAQTRRRVVVVGGGAAGMEAAWVASQRGHTVTLFEARPELGGKLVGSERFMPWHEVWQAVDFARRQVAKSSVTLRLGESADVAAIRALDPDAVILASGAQVGLPELPGDGSVPVHAFDAGVPDDLPDGHWVVMDADGYYWASALTEYLARQGRKVTYVTRFAQPLREVPEVARMSTLRTFDRLGVTILDNTSIVRVERGSLVFCHYYNADYEARLERVRGLVWVGIQHVEDRLAQPLREAAFASVHVVGDAKAPRRLAHALGEAHRAAREI